MLTGHASHQVGLDADIWLTPMPRPPAVARRARGDVGHHGGARPTGNDVDPKVWTPAHLAVIKAAAEDPKVERIFVNAAIKKALCREAGKDRAWLHKVRPWWGHDYHFHVRIGCPADSPRMQGAAAAGRGDGCGKDLDYWFTDAVLHPPPPQGAAEAGPPLTMADLPAACRQVLIAP